MNIICPNTSNFGVWMPANPAGPGGPGGPAVNPVALAQQAASSIHLPTLQVHTNPDHVFGAPGTVVNIATWLWVTGAWQALSATAAAGPVTVKATAAPTSVTWDTGDGHTVTCAGPGTPYAPGTQPACSYAYPRSSAGQPSPDGDPNNAAYTLRATVHWSITWGATGVLAGGTLPNLSTTSAEPLRVEEVESVNTN
jgi:hypothetical protein